MPNDGRAIAFAVLERAQQTAVFLSHLFHPYESDSSIDKRELQLAREIAYGTLRMQRALDYLASQLMERKQRLKRKERLLLRLSFYQYFYLQRIPLYAIADQMVELAKRHCHHTFCRFLNALLRKLEHCTLHLPEGEDREALAIRYSYPTFFVNELLQHYSLQQVRQILTCGNLPPKQMVRFCGHVQPSLCEAIHLVEEYDLEAECHSCHQSLLGHQLMRGVKEREMFLRLAGSKEHYVQNITPVQLVSYLAKNCPTPTSVLDLCASPGGKLLLCHDHFPDARLFANDVAEAKLEKLRKNIDTYKLEVTLSCSLGEEIDYPAQFDLIILDVPCSNSGVLNKRPEARWRLSSEQLKALESTQMRLIKRASELLLPGGVIWYLTCTILQKENEAFVEKACSAFSLSCQNQWKILPNWGGFDGGFAALLIKQ